MFQKSKKLISAETFEVHQEIFRCPLCKKPMQVIHLQSLVCSNQHCFDIAKHGYVNLLSRGISTKYDKKIFEYRRLISKGSLFNPLDVAVSQIIMNRHSSNEPISILDAGCGEGSHLNNIQIEINRKKPMDLLAAGIDISKEGISLAAEGYSNAIWCVADIANCPFSSQRFKFILNILSPANYSEFRRLISNKGLVIKVVPEQDYLKELREILYKGSDKQTYSNSLTISHFNKHFNILDIESIRYQADLSEQLIEPLLGMTPLSWGTSEERIEKFLQLNLKQVTMDFKILIGSVKNKPHD
ncbi:methyltransferase domain-containing protein [Paenibacillus sp. N4]|uniref:putative RNA methyltransferase n=1 Tax=Paenibacillus vietnamensis TaxID=2590547 RepID=UPI001CD0BCB8|nr:methyltransferase domain-containing protein [Paenibacillus vietnamensis]MCA0757275.1 methyltransferase domain-containing protein [Paenibacillus vietnamensis]